MQVGQLVSNICPINVYGKAWTACVWPYRSWPPCGRRSPNDLDVAANAAASAGSYGQRIESKRCANRYPTLEIPTQYFGAFLQPNELVLDPRRVRKLRKEPFAAQHPEETGI